LISFFNSAKILCHKHRRVFHHHLKLGGKILSFNLDPHFSDTLDGLMFVDLTKADHRVLKRYMGAEGFQEFMDYHSNERPFSQSVHRQLRH